MQILLSFHGAASANRNSLNFNKCILGQCSHLKSSASRELLREVLRVNRVHCCKVGNVTQQNRRLYNVPQLISESGILPTRLSREEKVRIVHKLNEEGLLNVKGAVAEIAERLSVSVPTVYRYLNKGSADAAGKG